MRNVHRPLAAALLAGSMLAGIGSPATAQVANPPAPAPSTPPPAATPAPASVIRAIGVTGNQRLEPDTVLSYTRLRVGQPYSRELLDAALKDLYETELFADVQIRDNDGALSIEVRENPVVNRIQLEGNKRIKEEKITPEIKLAARQIYTRSKVRADVARIIELYRRQGRFAATVEPKMVALDQNRVDIIFEINEGPKSKVQQINILGNETFDDGTLREQMVTKQSRWFRMLSSGTSYDPDKLAYDQQKLRQFYLTQGYADFRVVSAVAELTPDKQDFIITYVVEEGERYKFGDVKVKSAIRDLDSEAITKLLPMHKGEWYNAKTVEDTVNQLNETAGLYGYAFADVNPDFQRDPKTLTMSLTFDIQAAPRVYIERININGNTLTQDKVVRREFRLQEGDAFSAFLVKRSQDRINSLGFFQEKFEIEQKPGSAPDRIVLEANVQEKPTGELSLSVGYSSLEHFIISASITQRNFRGKGQELRTSVDYSTYSKSAQVGFTEPYLFDKNIALGGDIFRRDLNSFNTLSDESRNRTYQQVTTGFQLRLGVPITEYLTLAARYGAQIDNVTLDQATYYYNGACDPLLAGRYLCDAIGKRTTSSIGYTLLYDTRNNRIRPTRGYSLSLGQDFAGLGGDVRYIRTRLNADKYIHLTGQFVLALSAEGGYIHSLEKTQRDSAGNVIDPIRLTDRFFLGQPQLRGFDIRGVGPRVKRTNLVTTTDASGNLVVDGDGDPIYSLPTGSAAAGTSGVVDDALGGRAYYLAHAEIEIPLGAGARDLGLRPSIFMDMGSVFGLKAPLTGSSLGIPTPGICVISGTTVRVAPIAPGKCDPAVDEFGNRIQILSVGPYQEQYFGGSWKPRLSVGFGVNWNSPFGPFRIDIAKALLKQAGDDTKLVTFNVGTQF